MFEKISAKAAKTNRGTAKLFQIEMKKQETWFIN